MNEDMIFSEILHALRKRMKHIFMILILFIACGGAVGFWIPPIYEAELDVLVNAHSNSMSSVPSMSEIDTSLRLVETYKQIMKSDRVSKKVNSVLDGRYPKSEIRKKVKIESGNGSQIITIIAKDDTAEDVAMLANSYAEIFKEEIIDLMKLDNVTIMAEVSAQTDTTRVKPVLFYYFLISIFAGALTCLALILIQEIHFGNVDSEEKINKTLQLPLLGAIKKMKRRRKVEKNMKRQEKIFRRAEESDFAKLVANVVHQMKNENFQILLLTSALRGEGKSFIARHLAAALANGGKKTVFVDADLRKSDGAAIFNLVNRKGLTSIVRRFYSLLESSQETDHPYFTFIGTGPLPIDRLSLLQSEEWTPFMEDLRSMYDYIIIDAPDMSSPDVHFLLPNCDGVLFVIDRQSSRKDVLASVKTIRSLDGNMIGVVMNRQ